MQNIEQHWAFVWHACVFGVQLVERHVAVAGSQLSGAQHGWFALHAPPRPPQLAHTPPVQLLEQHCDDVWHA